MWLGFEYKRDTVSSPPLSKYADSSWPLVDRAGEGGAKGVSPSIPDSKEADCALDSDRSAINGK